MAEGKSAIARLQFPIIWFTIFLDFFAGGVGNPIFPRLVEDVSALAIPVASIVILLALTVDLVQLTFAPVVGSLSDAFGRRAIILVSILGIILSNVIRYYADVVWILIVSSILIGLMSSTTSTAMAAVADSTSDDRRTRAFANMTAAMGLGFAIGPIFGGVVAEFDLRLPFLIAGALGVANFALAFFLLRETLTPERRKPPRSLRSASGSVLREAFSRGALRPLLALQFALQTVTALLPVVVPLYLIERMGWRPSSIGLALSCFVIITAFLPPLMAARLSERFGERRVIALAMLCAGCGLVMLGFGQTDVYAWAGLLLAAGVSMGLPAVTGLISQSVAENEQGAVQGLSVSISAAAKIAVHMVFGAVFSVMGSLSLAKSWLGLPFAIVGLMLVLFAVVLARRFSST